MLPEILAAFALLAVCVVVHAAGLAALLRNRPLLSGAVRGGILSIAWLLVKIASSLLLLHLLQIAIWALFYRLQGCLPDLETAFYFSGVTYATVGYGDVVLPVAWRLLGPMEGLTGILMCGLSTGFFFVVVSRIYQWVSNGTVGKKGRDTTPDNSRDSL